METLTIVKNIVASLALFAVSLNGFGQCGSISSNPTVPICEHEPVTFTIQTSYPVTAWSVSTTFDFSTGLLTTIPSNNTSITFDEGFTQNVFVKAHLALCPENDPIYNVTVISSISENTIAASTNVISCTTPLPVLVNGSENTELIGNYFWQKSFDQVSWQNIPLSNTPDFTISSMPSQSFYLRRVIDPIACENNLSNELFIEAVNPPNGGELSGGGMYCDDEEIFLNLSNYYGTISTWQYSNNGVDFSPIGGTADATNFSPVVAPGTHYYRVLIENEGCEPAYSNVATVIQFAPLANEITSGNQYFCGSGIPETIVANTASGGGSGALSILWQRKPASSDDWQNIPGGQVTATTLPFSQPITETTHYRRLASSDNCSFSISNEVVVFVSAPTVAGTFTQSSQTICPGDDILPIVLEGHTGDIVDWFSAPSPTGPWTSLGHSDPIFVPQGNQATAFYRVLVQSGTCAEVYTSTYEINLVGDITSNNIQQDQSLCPGELPAQINGTFPQGGDGLYSLEWQERTVATDWTTAQGVNNQLNYTPPAIDETHFYRRMVSSGTCIESFSNEVEVTVHTPPTGLLTGGGLFCPGETAQITVELTGTPPFTITFNDGAETFTTDGILNTEHTITVDSNEPITYTLTAVSDAHCASNDNFENSSVTITPVPLPDPVSAGMDMYICGLTANLSGSDINPEFHDNYWTNSEGEIIATGSDFTFEADQAGMYELTYNVEVPGCNSIVSSTISVILDTQETAIAGNDQQICSTTTELNATEVETGSGHWIIPQGLTLSNQFDPNATISDMNYGESYELVWIAESIEGICPNDSATVWVHLDELSDAGILTSSASVICAEEFIALSLTNQTGEVNQWIFETAVGTETINSNQTSMQSDEFTSSMNVAVVVQSGTCPADTTDALWVEVTAPTNPGILSEDQEVCMGENQGLVELNGQTGEILFWEISADDFETIQTIESGQTSYPFVNLNETTSFRTMVQSGECPAVYSNTVTIEVVDQIEIQFDLAEEYCSNHEVIDLNALVEGGENGEWTVNGIPQTSFDPSMYGNSEVSITYTNMSSICGGTSSATTFVSETPVIWINADDESCGLTAHISAGTSAGEGTWNTSSGLQLNTVDEEIIGASAQDYGQYTISYTAINGICSSSETVNLLFHEPPGEANAGEDQQIEYAQSAQLYASPPVVGDGLWSAEDPDLSFSSLQEPNAKVYNLKPGKNTLYWTVRNGNCPASIDEVIIQVGNLIVPNAFSPNGDNVNDHYEISGLDAISPVRFKIWNRWGEEVFSSDNYHNEWEGRNKNGNELPSDTYYYLIETPATKDVLKGFIVLQR